MSQLIHWIANAFTITISSDLSCCFCYFFRPTIALGIGSHFCMLLLSLWIHYFVNLLFDSPTALVNTLDQPKLE